jgi:hypothetical protein
MTNSKIQKKKPWGMNPPGLERDGTRGCCHAKKRDGLASRLNRPGLNAPCASSQGVLRFSAGWFELPSCFPFLGSLGSPPGGLGFWRLHQMQAPGVREARILRMRITLSTQIRLTVAFTHQTHADFPAGRAGPVAE